MKSELPEMEAARQYYHIRKAQRYEQRERLRLHWLQRVRATVARLAPRYPGVRRVILFGSLIKPGRFHQDSDIDIMVDCDSPETESVLWRALERELQHDLDVRPLTGQLANVAAEEGKNHRLWNIAER